MHLFITFILFLSTTVVAKRGGGHSSGGGYSGSSSGEGPDPLAFDWTPNLLSTFILAIVYGVLTLGGGFWLAKCYKPASKTSGLPLLFRSTWGTWMISLIFYIFSGIWSGRSAIIGSGSIFICDWLASAFEDLATGGWISNVGHPPKTPSYLLRYTYTPYIINHLRWNLSTGDDVPLRSGRTAVQCVQDAACLYCALVLAALLLLMTAFMTRKATRPANGFKPFDPLRWIVFMAIPLWIATEILRIVLAGLYLRARPFAHSREILRLPAAQQLANLGVQVFKGDVSDVSTLGPALEGVTALHLVTTYSRGNEAEVEEAIAVFQLAKEKGIPHVVFSSAHGIETEVSFWASKKKIEKALKESGLEMDYPSSSKLHGQLYLFIGDGVNELWVSACFVLRWVEMDIGWFAATALTNPEEYRGTELFLCGDEISIDGMAEALGRVVDGTPGRKAWVFPIPTWLFYMIMPMPFAGAMRFFRDKPAPLSDLEDMKRRHPGLLSFEGYLKRQTSRKLN
ncbi:hypothetical protein DL96DRAFT_1818344 [Flagelloscypha sp. PMI_526]|nr:hypothetical protein DL96DRAFT_1818344 [Flagelloscypha sp. PMI_526]